jgi:anti-sigma-K factor RskA
MTLDEPPMDPGTSHDALAAEYVLGTLDAAERDEAIALIESDPSFAVRVRLWERRLGELHALAGGVEPPAAVWNAIKAKLPELPPGEPLRLPELPRPIQVTLLPDENVVDVVTLRMLRWRSIAAACGTMAALLAMFVVTSAVAPTILPDALRPKPRVIVRTVEAPGPVPPRHVAVLQRDATSPAFILTVDLDNRSLTVRRVSAESEPGKSYELWLVSDKFPAPRSLGLVGGGEFTQPSSLATYDPSTISDATFAVSLEPEGGSPTGTPTTVVYQGKLIESTPRAPDQPQAH